MPRMGKLLLTVNLPKTTRPKTIRPTLRATALHRTSRRRPWTGWSHRSSWPRNPACMWYCSATVSRDISRTPSSSSRTPRPSASYRRKRWCPNSSWIRPVKTTPNTLRCCCHTPPWTKKATPTIPRSPKRRSVVSGRYWAPTIRRALWKALQAPWTANPRKTIGKPWPTMPLRKAPLRKCLTSVWQKPTDSPHSPVLTASSR